MTDACHAVEPLLVDVVVAQADAIVCRVVDEHLARCHACAAACAELSASWRILDSWQVPPPPDRAEAAVFERVRADLGDAASPRFLAAALGLGLAAASAAAALIHLRSPVSTGGIALLACGGIWTVGFALAFHVVLSRHPGRGARAGLWASAALIALALACPVGTLADACHGSSIVTQLLGRGEGTYLAVGLLYGLVPAVVGLVATRRAGRGLRSTIPVLLAIAAFELPIFYLQCRPFAAGAFTTTLGGVLFGITLASLADLRAPSRASRSVT